LRRSLQTALGTLDRPSILRCVVLRIVTSYSNTNRNSGTTTIAAIESYVWESMTWKCTNCGAPVPLEKRDCQACGESNGAPNVRLAQSEAERSALTLRFHDAKISCQARGCDEALQRFGLMVLNSRAVIARSLAVVQDLVDRNETYTSYHSQLASGARNAEDNAWDLTRTQVDAALFPNFHKDIVFASLTLDGAGMSGYGDYVIELKEALIAKRASVFEANPYLLIEKLGWLLHKPIPAGYRATWEERNLLAMVKLHMEISPTTGDGDFPSILANDRGETGNSDFMEVHIFGPVNKHTVKKISGPMPKTREDRLLWKSLKRKLAEVGAELETA
jgi:hypothetical protein